MSYSTPGGIASTSASRAHNRIYQIHPGGVLRVLIDLKACFFCGVDKKSLHVQLDLLEVAAAERSP